MFLTYRRGALAAFLAFVIAGCAQPIATIQITGTPGTTITGYYVQNGTRISLTGTVPQTIEKAGIQMKAVRKVNKDDALTMDVRVTRPGGPAKRMGLKSALARDSQRDLNSFGNLPGASFREVSVRAHCGQCGGLPAYKLHLVDQLLRGIHSRACHGIRISGYLETMLALPRLVLRGIKSGVIGMGTAKAACAVIMVLGATTASCLLSNCGQAARSAQAQAATNTAASPSQVTRPAPEPLVALEKAALHFPGLHFAAEPAGFREIAIEHMGKRGVNEWPAADPNTFELMALPRYFGMGDTPPDAIIYYGAAGGKAFDSVPVVVDAGSGLPRYQSYGVDVLAFGDMIQTLDQVSKFDRVRRRGRVHPEFGGKSEPRP